MTELNVTDMQLGTWLDSLAARQPTPGGGAVAALAAAISAAQLSMVASYTTGPKWQDREARMLAMVSELNQIRQQALDLMAADTQAFKQVGNAYSLPKESDEDKQARQVAIQQALQAAATPPSDAVTLAIKLISCAEELAEQANPNLISDVTVGAAMAVTALESAIVNIEINLKQLEDSALREKLETIITSAHAAADTGQEVIQTVNQRIAG